MDPIYLHLVISHLPIFGCFLGIFVLTYGLLSKSRATMEAAYLVFILSGVGGVTAYLTGKPAEELVEHILGIADNTIEAHQDSAQLTIIALAILGSASCVALIFRKRSKQYHNEFAILILCIALICFSLTARTAYLGGKIRHSEIDFGRGLLGKQISMRKLVFHNSIQVSTKQSPYNNQAHRPVAVSDVHKHRAGTRSC